MAALNVTPLKVCVCVDSTKHMFDLRTDTTVEELARMVCTEMMVDYFLLCFICYYI